VGVPFLNTLQMENLGVRVVDCLPASVLTDLKSLAASKELFRVLDAGDHSQACLKVIQMGAAKF
jgi:hypothetical protein